MAGDPEARARGLDALKGLAVVAVVGIHALSTGVADLTRRPVVVAGGLLTWSVPAFMAMAAAFAAREHPAAALARRLRRLLPAYAVCTVAYLALAGAVGASPWARGQHPAAVALLGGAWYHLYFIPALVQVLVCLPALAWVADRRARLWPFLAAAVAALAVGSSARPGSPLAAVLASRYGLVWLPVAVIGIAADRHTLRLPGSPAWWCAGGLAMLGWESVLAADRGAPATAAYARPSLLVVTAAALAVAARWKAPPGPLVALGLRSLGVYLLHPAVLEALQSTMRLRPYPAWAALSVALITTIVAAMVTSLGGRVMRPFDRLGRSARPRGTLDPWRSDHPGAKLRLGAERVAEVGSMRAEVGDRIIVKSHHVGEPDRDGEILEVRGRDGAPPYLVRWSDGHEGLFFPGSDAVVQHFPKAEETAAGQSS